MKNITHIDHIAIAVNSIKEAKKFYEEALGLKVADIEDLPHRGIKVAFIHIGTTKIELIEPLHEKSEISSFLAKKGPGIHHMAFGCRSLQKAQKDLSRAQIPTIYPEGKPGAHNSKVNFIHPKDTKGVLVELVED